MFKTEVSGLDVKGLDVKGAHSVIEDAYKKVTWRLIPLIFLAYVISYLDRVNVGFAKLQMLSDLRFSEEIYGLGAGVFFIGYALFEVPSNIVLHKVGARRWISRIMITWGLVAIAMIFVKSETSFYILRFLLGVAEAGFQPGILLYLTYWYPEQRRGRIMGIFFMAVPASGIVGGPLSGWIMHSLPGVHGLAGWQWLFILEALPAVVLGILALRMLPDGIRKAKWLSKNEIELLEAGIQDDKQRRHEISLRAIFSNPRVLMMVGIYFCIAFGIYGISFWLPTIIKAMGVSDLLDIGLLSAAPAVAAIFFMAIVCRNSDVTGERKLHLAAAIAFAAAGLAISVWLSSNAVMSLFALSIGAIGVYTSIPLFWNLPTGYLAGLGAAAGIAFINALANVSGFVAPYMIGWIKQTTGSTDIAILMLALVSVIGMVLVLSLPARLVNRQTA